MLVVILDSLHFKLSSLFRRTDVIVDDKVDGETVKYLASFTYISVWSQHLRNHCKNYVDIGLRIYMGTGRALLFITYAITVLYLTTITRSLPSVFIVLL